MNGQKRKLLIYGDSNTYGYDPADLYENRYPAGKRWTNLLQDAVSDRWVILAEGMNGRKLPDLRYDSDRILRLAQQLSNMDVFATMLGTNDILITMRPDAETVIAKMDQFLSFLCTYMKSENILVIAPPPAANIMTVDSRCRMYYDGCLKMNAGFRQMAEKYSTMFLDAGTWDIRLSSDLVHFSEEGHRRFAEKMAGFLKELE